MAIKPILKLSQYPKEDNSRPLFEKYTNPWNTAKVPLDKQGTVTAIFEKEGMKLIVDGRYPVNRPCTDAAPLSKIVDPQGKLKSLIETGKIVQIRGNCNLDQAQVILLDDTCHLDQKQAIIRGEVANALKGTVNVYLCEVFSSSTTAFGKEAIDKFFAPNLDLTGPRNYFSGWDDRNAYLQSMELIKQGLEKKNLSKNDLDKVMNELAFVRTNSLWKTIDENCKHWKGYNVTIVVFGGAGHLGDKWLHEQMIKNGVRFAEITPAGDPTPVTEKQMQEYYRVKNSN